MGALAVAALALGYVVSGFAILTGIGLVRGAVDAVLLSGVALIAGWCATGTWLSLVLVAGFDVTVSSVLIGWLAVAVAGAVLAGKVPAAPSLVGELPEGRRRLAVAGGAVVLAVAAGLLIARSVLWSGLFHGDVWSFWIPKAKTIFFFDGLDTAPGGFTSQVSPDYPPLKPAIDAAVFVFAGEADPLLLPPHNAILAVGFLAAVIGLLWRAATPGFAVAGALVIAALPAFRDLAGSSLADESLAIVFALACLLVAQWLLTDDPRTLAVASLLLAASILTKNEGALFAALIVILLLLVVTRRLRVLLAALLPTAAFVMWRAWLVAHDIPRNPAQRFEKLADPSHLAGHLDHLEYGTRRLTEEVADPRLWSAAVPLALVAAVTLAGRRTPLAVVAIGVPIASLAGFAVIYWIGPNRLFEFEPPYTFIEDNVGRVVAPVALTSATLLPLLVAEAQRGTRSSSSAAGTGEASARRREAPPLRS